MTPKEILIAARAKIEAPERWTQGAYAKDVDGQQADPCGKRAICWCIYGAVMATTDGDYHKEHSATVLIGEIVNNIARWNDAPTRTHAEVLAAFDRAIAAAGDA